MRSECRSKDIKEPLGDEHAAWVSHAWHNLHRLNERGREASRGYRLTRSDAAASHPRRQMETPPHEVIVYSTVALDLLYSTRSCDLLLVPTVRYRIRKAVFNMIQHDDYVDRYDGVE